MKWKSSGMHVFSRAGDAHARTKDDEASVRICGAQRILGGAAIHGSIELGRHSLQNQLLSLPLRAAIQ